MITGNSKNLHAFNFTIPFKSLKSDGRKIYVFYSEQNEQNRRQEKIKWLEH